VVVNPCLDFILNHSGLIHCGVFAVHAPSGSGRR